MRVFDSQRKDEENMLEQHRRTVIEREMEMMAEQARFFETMEAEKEFAGKIQRMKQMLDKR